MFLFPLRCRLCCEVQYCSQSCRDRAWSQYHKVECSLGPLLKMVGIMSSDLSNKWEMLLAVTCRIVAGDDAPVQGVGSHIISLSLVCILQVAARCDTPLPTKNIVFKMF